MKTPPPQARQRNGNEVAAMTSRGESPVAVRVRKTVAAKDPGSDCGEECPDDCPKHQHDADSHGSASLALTVALNTLFAMRVDSQASQLLGLYTPDPNSQQPELRAAGSHGIGCGRAVGVGAARHEPAFAFRVNAPVREHVVASVPRLPWGAQQVRVVAIGEDLSAPAHDAVQGPGHANLQALHGARERELVGCLDDEVDVVPLHGEVNEAEAEPGAAAFESAPQLAKAAMRAKVPDFLPHARGHVQRAAAETGTRAMSDVASRALALPPCTLSCTAPERKSKLLLFCDHPRSVRAGSDMDSHVMRCNQGQMRA